MTSQLWRSLFIFSVGFRLLADYLWLDFTNRFRSETARQEASLRALRRAGALLHRTALRLHGLIIKVGQFLSARADLFPETFTRELASLQDAVPTAPIPALRSRVETELGAPIDTVFAEFANEAIASASLGEVHRARLKDGTAVVVKVLRPGIERVVATDLTALRRILRFMHKYTSWGGRFNLLALMNEFETITYQELDYRQEAENMRRFHKNFANTPGIGVPFPFDNLVSEKLLVMEFKAGMKVTEHDRLREAGLNPAELAERMVDVYLQQLFVDGFVHVDPHPGNLIIQADGTVVFVDFGMMGAITIDDRRHLSSLATNLLGQDFDGAVQDLRALGFLGADGNVEPLKRAMALLLSRLGGGQLKSAPALDSLLGELREWLNEEPIQLPARFLYMGRAVGLLAGICSGLDPHIDWMKILKERAMPLLESTARGSEAGTQAKDAPDWRRMLSDIFGPGAGTLADAVLKQAGATGVSLVRMPGQLERVLGKLENGALRVQVEVSGGREQREFQSRLVSRISWGLLAATAGLCGTMLRTGGLITESKVAWSMGALFLLGLLVTMRTGRRTHRPRATRL